MTRALAVTSAKYALGLALLGYVIAQNWSPRDGSPGLSDALSRPINFAALALAAAFSAVSVTTTFVRWFGLVRAQELPFSLRDACRIGMAAYFFNTVLPGSIGGDIVKAVGLAREQSRRTVAVATVVFDRLIGLWGLIWLVSIFGAIFTLLGTDILRDNAGLRALVETTWAVLGVTVLAWLACGLLSAERAERWAASLARRSRIGLALAEAWRAVWMYRRKPRAVAVAIGLSFVSQIMYVLAFHWAARVFAGQADMPTLSEHALVVPPGMVVQAVFPSPGGVGGGEFGFGKLYELLGRAESLGVLGSLAMRMISWGLGLIGYLIYLQMKHSASDRSQPDQNEPQTNPDRRGL